MPHTFADFRHSRHLTQSELARLIGRGRASIARWDPRPLEGKLLAECEACDTELENGPHLFVERKLLDPLTLKPIEAQTVHRLPVGKVFAALEYYNPSDEAWAALKMRRPDLADKAKRWAKHRVVSLYRILTSRYSREERGKGFGVQLLDMRKAVFPPLDLFETVRESVRDAEISLP